MFWFYVLPLGFLLTQYTITGFDSCAHISEETHGAADNAAKGVWRSIFYSAIFGWVLLLAITFARHQRRRRQQGRRRRRLRRGVDPPARARHRVVQARARHLDRRAALLRRRVPDQRVAHVLRVQPRRRDPRLAHLEQGQLDADPVQRRALHGRVRRLLITVPAYWPASNGVPVAFYAVVSIAVIGLYIAYVIPIYLRWRMGDAFEPGPWTLGRKYKWMNPFATVWVALITIIFILPTNPGGVPWNDEFDWKLVNYAPLVTGARDPGGRHLVAGQRAPHVHRPAPHDRRDRRGARRAARRAASSLRRPDSAVTLQVIEPATEEVLAEVQRATAADVDAAVARAKAAFPAWRAVAPGDRARLLHRPRRHPRRAPRGARGPRGAQRGQADRRRARRDGDGGRHLPLLRRRRPSACWATPSRCRAGWGSRSASRSASSGSSRRGTSR